jgi:hypothetical protein
MHPSHGERPEHLTLRILQPSQARLVILRPVPDILGSCDPRDRCEYEIEIEATAFEVGL